MSKEQRFSLSDHAGDPKGEQRLPVVLEKSQGQIIISFGASKRLSERHSLMIEYYEGQLTLRVYRPDNEQPVDIDMLDTNEDVKRDQPPTAIILINDVDEYVTEEWMVVHPASGETVKDGFPTESLAHDWLESAVKGKRVEPAEMDAYAVEQVEQD